MGKRWEDFVNLRKDMLELADEIIEIQLETHDYNGWDDRLIHLYDRSDSVFSAQNVKRVIEALDESVRIIGQLGELLSKMPGLDADEKVQLPGKSRES